MSSNANACAFQVQKTDIRKSRIVEGPVPTLADGQVLFKVDRFALTANNISYGMAGEMLGYWNFYPVEGVEGTEGWGHIPAMGYATVVGSTHPEVEEGTRCFGFYPMGRYAVIQPGSVGSQIVDASPCREGIAAAYNQYSPVHKDPAYVEEHEDAVMLMRGLFMTSFLAEDFLSDEVGDVGSVLISSASSKTSIALAHLVSNKGKSKSVGLTSAGNVDFVKSLGCYDEILTYDAIESLPSDQTAVYVDMSGNGGVQRTIHSHFADQLKHSCSIGATHWEADRSVGELAGPKPEFFFAPSQIAKRSKDWGPVEFQKRLGSAWLSFREFSDTWMRVERSYGQAAMARVFDETLNGRTSPAEGQILSLWESAEEAAG